MSKGNNPNSRKVKCLNINTKEELVFNSFIECQNFFKENNHDFIYKRCQGKTKCLYKQEWMISYFENDYNDFSINKNNYKQKGVKIIDLVSKEEFIFQSFSIAERTLGIYKGFISDNFRKDKTKNKITFKDKYEIIII